jgi:hypothetical protein
MTVYLGSEKLMAALCKTVKNDTDRGRLVAFLDGLLACGEASLVRFVMRTTFGTFAPIVTDAFVTPDFVEYITEICKIPHKAAFIFVFQEFIKFANVGTKTFDQPPPIPPLIDAIQAFLAFAKDWKIPPNAYKLANFQTTFEKCMFTLAVMQPYGPLPDLADVLNAAETSVRCVLPAG